MLPPFPTADHRIGPSPAPFEERRVLRRGAPAPLRLEVPTPGWPPLALRPLPPPPPPCSAPSGGGLWRRLVGALRVAPS